MHFRNFATAILILAFSSVGATQPISCRASIGAQKPALTAQDFLKFYEGVYQAEGESPQDQIRTRVQIEQNRFAPNLYRVLVYDMKSLKADAHPNAETSPGRSTVRTNAFQMVYFDASKLTTFKTSSLEQGWSETIIEGSKEFGDRFERLSFVFQASGALVEITVSSVHESRSYDSEVGMVDLPDPRISPMSLVRTYMDDHAPDSLVWPVKDPKSDIPRKSLN